MNIKLTREEAKQWIEDLIYTMREETSGNFPDVAYKDEVYVALDMAIKEFEQKPKTGHWGFVQRGKYVDMNCSECGATRIKEYAYNYTVDQLDKENLKEITEDLRFCEKCGAKMESEDNE